MRSKSTEVKPIWNGVYLRNLCYNKLKKKKKIIFKIKKGPFKQTYLWRDDKLKDQ